MGAKIRNALDCQSRWKAEGVVSLFGKFVKMLQEKGLHNEGHCGKENWHTWINGISPLMLFFQTIISASSVESVGSF